MNLHTILLNKIDLIRFHVLYMFFFQLYACWDRGCDREKDKEFLHKMRLFRNWAGHDEQYLVTQNLWDNLMGDMDGKMNITVNPKYVAPKEIYKTSHGMCRNTNLNKSLNLTWEFPIHSFSVYMVKLHFCELDLNINDIGERMFIIYIGTELAGDSSVMKWSQKQKSLAVHRDYIIMISTNDIQKKVNLSL